jgi:hypothetical protein
MVHKPQKGRYLSIEDVRVSYNHKDDTIHLTTSDPDIPHGAFYITLKQGTPTETSLRELLSDHNLIKEQNVRPTAKESFSPFPQILIDTCAPGNKLQTVNIIGIPGTGKTVLARTIAKQSTYAGLPVNIITNTANEYDLPNSTVHRISTSPAGSFNIFNFNLKSHTIAKIVFASIDISWNESYYASLAYQELHNLIIKTMKDNKPSLIKLASKLLTRMHEVEATKYKSQNSVNPSSLKAALSSLSSGLDLLLRSKNNSVFFRHSDNIASLSSTPVNIYSLEGLDYREIGFVFAALSAIFQQHQTQNELLILDVGVWALPKNPIDDRNNTIKNFFNEPEHFNKLIINVTSDKDEKTLYNHLVFFKTNDPEINNFFDLNNLPLGTYAWVDPTAFNENKPEFYYVKR